MKFILALLPLAVSVIAQTNTTTTTSASTPATTTAPVTPTQSCLAKCPYGDVNCQAICVGVPHPGESQMNALTDCVGKCDQGDGSTAASERYAVCRNACISSLIITSGTAAPGGAYTTAGKPLSASASSGADSKTTSSSVSRSIASTASDAAKASASHGAAPRLQQSPFAGGLLSLFLGAFAVL